MNSHALQLPGLEVCEIHGMAAEAMIATYFDNSRSIFMREISNLLKTLPAGAREVPVLCAS